MKFRFALLSFVSILISTGCTHKQVQVTTLQDNQMNCTEIITEYAKTELILEDVDDKTGFSGRNVAMGIFFWPGIFVNQMNATDARTAANNRIAVLTTLSTQKKCTVDRQGIDVAKAQLSKDFNKSVQEVNSSK